MYVYIVYIAVTVLPLGDHVHLCAVLDMFYAVCVLCCMLFNVLNVCCAVYVLCYRCVYCAVCYSMC